jgi:acetyl-CoA C-acetyltransferase
MNAADPRADPHQPVLVGIGTCMQREDDPARAREPLDLMVEAVLRAAQDAGGAHMLRGVQRIAVPRGRWRYRNPGGAIARAIGADAAVSVLASVGVLQQSLVADACVRIAAGEIDSALVAGGDAGYRLARARAAGQRAPEAQQDDGPDVLLEPEEELLHPAELQAGIRLPVALYAILESAWRARQGWTVDEHRARLARMYEGFANIATGNPHAWRRKPVSADEIGEPSERNPLQAFPYTRLHCASWNVDQAGALLLCSVRKAEALGIPRRQWVYPLASTESNHMQAVSARADLVDCVGARLAGRAVLDAAGLQAGGIDLLELYSCFPIAVQSHAHALGIPLDRAPTVTGGMPFAGGPFNNYVLQATCRLAELLRAGQGDTGRPRTGLVSSVSGILTKHGFGLWSTEAGPRGFHFADVSQDTARHAQARTVLPGFDGLAVVAGCTVVHDTGRPPRALVLADTPAGERVLASSEEPAVVASVRQVECCGSTVRVQGQAFALQ